MRTLMCGWKRAALTDCTTCSQLHKGPVTHMDLVPGLSSSDLSYIQQFKRMLKHSLIRFTELILGC